MTYGMQASAPGYGQNEVSNKNNYVIKAGEAIEAKPITLASASASVSGRVVSPAGDPISGISVSLHGQQTRSKNSVSDVDGRFKFDKVVEEEYLTLNAQGRERYDHVNKRLQRGAYKDIELVLFEKFDYEKKLSAGKSAPELKDVKWLQDEWTGFEAAQGKRVAVAFISVKNALSRKAIRALQQAMSEQKEDRLMAVLVHDASATADEITKYLAAGKITLPLAQVKSTRYEGWYSAAFRAYGVKAIPTIVLIGANGKVTSGRCPVEELVATLKQP